MRNVIEISASDYWVKIVEMLQQNWALIEQHSESCACTVYFIHDLSGVFDRMEFPSEEKAIRALKRNEFERYEEQEEGFHNNIPAPQPPFFETEHPSGPIYSSGRFWKRHNRDHTLEKFSIQRKLLDKTALDAQRP